MLTSLISTRIHGILDYVVGLLLIAAPWMLGFADNHWAMIVPVTLGAATIIYSLITDYELGVAHLVPMTVHLLIDLLGGMLLATSPWLFGFASRIIWPHVAAGAVEIAVVLMSSRIPSYVAPDISGNNQDFAPAEVI